MSGNRGSTEMELHKQDSKVDNNLSDRIQENKDRADLLIGICEKVSEVQQVMVQLTTRVRGTMDNGIMDDEESWNLWEDVVTTLSRLSLQNSLRIEMLISMIRKGDETLHMPLREIEDRFITTMLHHAIDRVANTRRTAALCRTESAVPDNCHGLRFHEILAFFDGSAPDGSPS